MPNIARERHGRGEVELVEQEAAAQVIGGGICAGRVEVEHIIRLAVASGASVVPTGWSSWCDTPVAGGGRGPGKVGGLAAKVTVTV